MKVAVVLGDVGPMAGGGFTFQDDLMRALLDAAPTANHEFLLVGSFDESSANSLSPTKNISFLSLGTASERLRRVAAAFFRDTSTLLRAAGLRHPLDRHLRQHGVGMIWFATPFFRGTDLPYIFTVWDLQHRVQPWFPEVSSGGRWEYRERTYRRAVERATRIIAANSAASAELVAAYGLLPDRVLQLPHPTPAFALAASGLPRRPHPTQLSEVGKYFFYPAQFGPHKNHISLLRAVAFARERLGVSLHVALVGVDRGNLAFVRRSIAALRVSDLVHIFGFVSRDDLVAFYQNARALVFPSFFGPENLPPLEAFALGCPVLAARVRGSQEQLGNDAVLFDPVDHEAIALAMISMLEDSAQRANLVLGGNQRARKWTARDYVCAVLSELDHFASVRACWP